MKHFGNKNEKLVLIFVFILKNEGANENVLTVMY